MLAGIDLEVRAGEIVGIGGLQGAGRTELVRALFGADPFSEGTVEVDGAPAPSAVPPGRHRRRPRLPDRGPQGRGPRSRAVGARQRAAGPPVGCRPAAVAARRTTDVEALAAATELRAASLEQEVRFLSGGNQQKVVLAKWLALEPGVLLFDEPTRGIDVGAKAAIHDLMRDLARQGRAIVMISSELPELIGISDRIVVLHEGRIAGELPAGATEQQVIALAAGHDVDEAVPA